jgi:hypothetical protein
LEEELSTLQYQLRGSAISLRFLSSDRAEKLESGRELSEYTRFKTWLPSGDGQVDLICIGSSPANFQRKLFGFFKSIWNGQKPPAKAKLIYPAFGQTIHRIFAFGGVSLL